MKKFISIDTETYKVQPGLLAPPLVCLTYSDGETTRLVDKYEAVNFTLKLLLDKDINIVGHRVPYDLAVLAVRDSSLLPLIFDALDQGRIYDTQINQKLIDIALGELKFFDYKSPDGSITKMLNKHSLEQYTLRYLHKKVNKGVSSWQVRFGELDGLPVEDYPEEASKYALQDAQDTWIINQKQLELAGSEIPTRELQVQASWALHLMGIWGCRTNKNRTLDLRERLLAKREVLKKRLLETGLVKKNGKRDLLLTRRMVEEAYKKQELPPPLTEKNNICTDKNALADSGDPILKGVTEYISIDKQIGTYLSLLLQATDRPFNPAWNCLVSSGRTSCGGEEIGNLQNLPRDGEIRNCFEPREGYVYCSTDLDTAELRGWGEVCLDLVGHSVMVDDIKSGRDPHLALGADILGISYEKAVENKNTEEVKKARQFAKIGNFGLPGGLSPDSLVGWAKNQDIKLEPENAIMIYKKWMGHFTEARDYFSFHKALCGGYGQTTTYKHHLTGFVRGDVGYTDLCNHQFQHLVSCGAKAGLYNITKECYLDSHSPLFGTRPTFFIHDETISEMPRDRAHEAAYRQAELQAEGLRAYIKRTPVTCSPALMDRWYKNAKENFDENEKLIPWEP